MEKYDVVVLGGGPGGYLCAERAAQAGFKAAVVEKRALGGTCLNEGCVPTKALLYCAKNYSAAKHAESYGFEAKDVKINHAAVVDRKNKIVKTLVGGVGATMKSNKIKVYDAEGSVKERTAEGFVINAGAEQIVCDRLVMATGSVTSVPPITGLKEGLASGFVVTNREVLDLKELPKTIVCLGGGVIGLEMACYFATVGCKVIIVEMMPKIAGPTDADICKLLQKTYEKEGMEFRLNAKVQEIGANSVTYEDAEGKHTIECDKVLLSAGRRANIVGSNIEALGVTTERGAIVTDSHMCTNVQGVYAVGDCNGKLMLAHTAYREAEVAVHHMQGVKDEMRYDHIPSVIYTNPEVASVGYSEDAAKQLGMNVKTYKVPMMMSGRYVAETLNGEGFCKLVYDVDKKCLVGCHMIGNYASEMIISVALMLDVEMPIEQIKKTVFPHPTVCEVIREGLFMIK